MIRCPGQDQRFWKPDDIFEVKCPHCDGAVEFFKDEPKLKCRKCKKLVFNPKLDLGCAQWCRYAQQCSEVLQPPDTGAGSDKASGKKKKALGRKVQDPDD
jgi:hypothetical protein